jgi:hypothetical protein
VENAEQSEECKGTGTVYFRLLTHGMEQLTMLALLTMVFHLGVQHAQTTMERWLTQVANISWVSVTRTVKKRNLIHAMGMHHKPPNMCTTAHEMLTEGGAFFLSRRMVNGTTNA